MFARLIFAILLAATTVPSMGADAANLFARYAELETYYASGELSERTSGNGEKSAGAFELYFARGRGWRVEHGGEVFVCDGRSLLIRYPSMNAHAFLDFGTETGWQQVLAIEGPATRGLRHHPVLALLEGLPPQDWGVTTSDETLDVRQLYATEPLPWSYGFESPGGDLRSTWYGLRTMEGPSWSARIETESRGADIDASLFDTTPPPTSFDLTEQLVRTGGSSRQHPLVGNPAPPLEGMQTGKTTVLDFWAIWCPPCLEGLPKLNEYVPQLGEGVVVIGVNCDTDAERIAAAKRFVGEKGIAFPQVYAGRGGVPGEWKAGELPMMAVVRPDGIVHDVHVGALRDAATLKKLILDASAAAN